MLKKKAILIHFFPKYARDRRNTSLPCWVLPSLNKASYFSMFTDGEQSPLKVRLSFRKLNVDKAWLNKLKKGMGKGYELLDPTLPRTNNIIKTGFWM